MPNGVIIIDKPQGWTSMDVCAKLRGIFHEKRVGHAGTLDPMATGVLPVFLGRATRAVEFAAEGAKEYHAVLRLGTVTDTQDVTGTVLETKPVTVTSADIEAALPRFRGDIEQVPPMYSAIKVDGKKLYDLARKGKEVERRPRPVTIHALELGEQLSGTDFCLRVECSKGTYIRTLCHDIGQALGCGATMAALRRTCAAGYTLAQAVTLEQVQGVDDPSALLAEVDSCFAHLPALVLTAAQSKCVRNGMAFTYPNEGEWRVYDPDGDFLAVCRTIDGRMTTVKSFFNV